MNRAKLNQFKPLHSEINLGFEDSSLLGCFDVSTHSHREFKD